MRLIDVDRAGEGKRETAAMSKRILKLFILALIPVGLLAGLAVLAGGQGTTGKTAAAVASSKEFVPTGGWSDLPAFPSVVLNFGGSSSGCVGTSASSPLKLKRALAVAYPPNGKVYILGGRHRADGDDINSEWIYEYTPGGGSYVLKNARLDNCRYTSRWTSNMAGGVLTDGSGARIYAVGGSNVDSVVTNTVRIYNPVADSITTLTTDPWPASPMRLPGGYAVYSNKLYIFGGYNPKPTSTMYSDTWVFDPMAPAGTRWSQLTSANLSVARGFIAGAVLDGFIYAIGGNTVSGVVSTTVTPQTIVERIDPNAAGSPSWQPVASLPSARGDMAAWAYDTGSGYEIAGKIVAAGGGYPMPTSSAYVYDVATNSWNSFTSMLRARRNMGYTQLDGILYAFGGYNVTNVYDGSNDSMKYDASSCALAPNYNVTESTGNSLVSASNLVPGSVCNNCTVAINLPFSYSLYDQSFTTANVSPKGTLQFMSSYTGGDNSCLPATNLNYAIATFWDEIGTGPVPTIGVYTEVIGTAPNRTFIVEWKSPTASGPSAPDWEVLLYEGQPRFDIIFRSPPGQGSGATVGVQEGTGTGLRWMQWSCNQNTIQSGDKLVFNRQTCPLDRSKK
jgi:hypothetical protein